MHRKHGHMHTLEPTPISLPISRPSPPLARQGPAANDHSLYGPESITPEDFDPAFDELHRRLKEASRNPEMVSEDGQVYDFEKLERIDLGLAPVTFQEGIQLVGSNSGSSSWDVESLLMSLEGV